MVRPLRPSSRNSSRISTIPAGSSPFVGSSRMSSSGSGRSAAAIPSRCFMPSEKRFTGSRSRPTRPTCASTASTRSSGSRRSWARDTRLARADRPGMNAGLSIRAPTREA